MTYPLPRDEKERLTRLKFYQILDTPPEEEFDDIVGLAAQICGTKLASITFIDESRQWFKARLGMADQETDRKLSFCAHAICLPEDQVFVIPDAREDERFRDYANVTGAPHIRFYAGLPLVSREGSTLGTLCVIDTEPRELTPDQLRALRVLRRHVVTALELRRLVHEQAATISRLEATQVELEKARHSAEEATRAKSRFLATMSHEIRTPMNAVVGMTSLLADSTLDSVQRDYVDTLRGSGELLLTLINDILDFSKIEAGQLELERIPFDLKGCVQSATELVAGAARAKGLALTTKYFPGLPATAVGDATRLRQILLNLLSNSVKFTQQGGVTVSVSSRALTPGLTELHFSIADTGVGIPADRLNRLFKHYSQTDVSTSRQYGGTGLGLAISKLLSELHGGRIWVESTPGSGTVFHFTIHAGVDTSARPAVSLAVKFDPGFAAEHPCYLLVADDDPINRLVIQRILGKLGYRPDLVSDGDEAVEALRATPYDLMFVDMEMPRLDGPATTARIRAEFPPEAQPVLVAFTARAMVGDREHCLEQGFDEHLTKPVRLEQLMVLLASVPELKARRAKLAQG